MLTGTLTYAAQMKGLQFDQIEIQPQEPAVERVQLANPDGKELQISVCFSAISSHDEARAIAARLMGLILDRLAFHQNTALPFPTPFRAPFPQDHTADCSVP